MERTIEVVPHNPQWSEQLEREVEELSAIFGEEIVKDDFIKEIERKAEAWKRTEERANDT